MKKDSTSFATLGSRLFVSGTLIVCLTALAWADSTGFLGSLPGWWLLPVLILLAIAGVNEFISLYMIHGIRLKGGLLRVGVVAIFLAVAVGTQAMVSDTGDAAPVAALSWAALAAAVAIGSLFIQEIFFTLKDDQDLNRLAASIFVLTYLGLPMAFIVGLRLVTTANLGPEQSHPQYLGIIPLLSLIAVVKAGDIFAYLIGSALGRIPLMPKISPGKTCEGAVASLAGSLFTSWVYYNHLSSSKMGCQYSPLGDGLLLVFVSGFLVWSATLQNH